MASICQRNRTALQLAEVAASPRQAAAAAPAPDRNTAAAAASPAASAKANGAAAAAAAGDAAASAAAAGANAAAASAAAAAVSAATASVQNGKLYAWSGASGAFFVEEIEGREADVGDFLVERRDPKRCRILPEYVGYRSGRGPCHRRRRYIRRRSAGRRRQRHPGDSEHRHSLTRTFPVRSTLRLRHSRAPPLLPSTKFMTKPIALISTFL